MSRSNTWMLRITALTMVAVGVGCDGASDTYQRVPEHVDGIEELAQPLSVIASCPAATGCTFVTATGALTVSLVAADVAIISKHPVSGAILVNDVATPGATSTTVKTIAITAAGAVHTVIMDFANGTFAPGTATVPGITIDWGATAGINAFKVRGSSTAADTVTAGQNSSGAFAVSFNTDAYADIVFTNASKGTETYTFSLGGGNDIFGADAVSAVARFGASSTAMPATHAVTVYGGPGDDQFQGGLGADFFYGDAGNDTFKGGTAHVAGTKTFAGGADTDTADYSARPASVNLVLKADGSAFSGQGVAELNKINSDVEVLKGGAGNDTYTPDPAGLVGHAFYGGAGTDTADYSGVGAAVTVTMADKLSNDGVPTTQKDDIRDDVENLKCATGFACTVTGNTLDNTFTVPVGSTVAHSFSGGTGIDLVDFSALTAVAHATGLDVKMDFTASTTNGLLINTDVENIKCPTAAIACTVVGNAAANHIWGGGALDTISTGAGDDIIEGVGGAVDIIDCGDGSDILLVTSALTTPAVGCEL
ncbi:MAG: hypothetical protein HY901_20905 [Deltaproteobacteria bacterium]|nr:hypothetical protein [Deltaproteobacteria bacterium]